MATAAGVNRWSTSVCRTTNRRGTRTSPTCCSTTKWRSTWSRTRRWWNTRYTVYVRWLLLYNYIVVLSNVLLHDEYHTPTTMMRLYRSPKIWLTLLIASRNVIWPRATWSCWKICGAKVSSCWTEWRASISIIARPFSGTTGWVWLTILLQYHSNIIRAQIFIRIDIFFFFFLCKYCIDRIFLGQSRRSVRVNKYNVYSPFVPAFLLPFYKTQTVLTLKYVEKCYYLWKYYFVK